MWASPKTMAFRILLVALLVAILLVTGLRLPGWLGTTLTAIGALLGLVTVAMAIRRDDDGRP